MKRYERKRKIVLLTDCLAYLTGGAERQIFELAKRLDKEKYSVTIASLECEGNAPKEAIESNGCQLATFPVKRIYGLSGLLEGFRFKKFLENQNVDILITYHFSSDIWGTFFGRLAKTKTIISNRRDMGFWRKRRHIWAYRVVNRWVSKIIVVAQAVKEVVCADEDVPQEKIEVIHNGVDLEDTRHKTQDAGLKKELGIKKEDFRKEIKFLSKYFEIRSLDDVVATLEDGKKFKRPTIVLTVDDGFKDNFELMFPLLKEKNIPATIFLSTAVIGTNEMNWYDRFANTILHTTLANLQLNGFMEGKKFRLNSLKHKRFAYDHIVQKLKDIDIQQRDQHLREIEAQLGLPKEEKPLMLNWDEISTMAESNISFGAHTHTHPILTKMPLEDAKQDIVCSKEIIKDKLGVSVKHFAYPNGRKNDFNEELQKYCREIGFLSISTFEYGHNQKTDDVWSLKRVGSESPIGFFAVNVVRAFLKGNE